MHWEAEGHQTGSNYRAFCVDYKNGAVYNLTDFNFQSADYRLSESEFIRVSMDFLFEIIGMYDDGHSMWREGICED